MPLWLLEPKDLEHPIWTHQLRHPKVVVEASDEWAARITATAELSLRLLRRRGISMQDVDASNREDPGSPWKNKDATTCVIIDAFDDPLAECFDGPLVALVHG